MIPEHTREHGSDISQVGSAQGDLLHLAQPVPALLAWDSCMANLKRDIPERVWPVAAARCPRPDKLAQLVNVNDGGFRDQHELGGEGEEGHHQEI